MIHVSSSKRGFTLIELLVAMAIFSIIMVVVVGLFVSSLRTTRQANQMVDAYEMARGAFNVIERDLTVGFTAREHGDAQNFFGTPIGFMFVGTANYARGDAARTKANLGRITYVVSPYISSTTFSTLDEEKRNTYALVRFIEPGRQDLDTFPFQWPPENYPELAGAELGSAEYLMWQALYCVRNTTRPLADSGLPAAVVDAIVAARKREMWIRMIGRDARLLEFLPDIWEQLGEEPRDYIVAEGVAEWGIGGERPLDEKLEIAQLPENLPVYVQQRPLLPLRDKLPAPLGDGWEDYWLDRVVVDYGMDNEVDYYYPVYHAADAAFFRYAQVLKPTLRIEDESLVWTPYWNAEANIPGVELLNAKHPDYESSALSAELALLMLREAPARYKMGSPLSPRVPELVETRLPFTFERTMPGAADFKEDFVQIVDLPAGYARMALRDQI
jgi:prepilin-type N-terminal cleavage/methylation domain-containing protein